MTPYRWLFSILTLLLGERWLQAAEKPPECWCIPAIQRQAVTTRVNEQAQPLGVLDESLENIADRLYALALKLEREGESIRAVDKLTTILEQYPKYRPATRRHPPQAQPKLFRDRSSRKSLVERSDTWRHSGTSRLRNAIISDVVTSSVT